MSIQLDMEHNMVRVGNRFFPAQPFSKMTDESIEYGIGVGYTIPLGESSKFLSIAMGRGTYNEHYDLAFDKRRIDPETEMNTVEVGFDFGGERGFDVVGYINDDELCRIIIRAMSGEDPF